MQIIIGFILGLIVSAVGFSTVAHYADKGVQAVQSTVREVAK